MVSKLTKILLSLIQNKRGRKALRNLLLIVLSPLILILVFIVSAADGTSKHNHEVMDILFQGKEIAESVPNDYKGFLLDYQNLFDEIDVEIESLHMDSGRLDPVLIKSIVFIAFIEEETISNLSDIDVEKYVSLFYTAEEIIEEKPESSEEPTESTDEESEIEEDNQIEEKTCILKPIQSTEILLERVTTHFDKDLVSKKELLYEIYNVALTGMNKELDGYVPMASLLKEVYINSEQSLYVGGTFQSPFYEVWRPYVTSEFGPRTPFELPDGTITQSFHTGIDFGRAKGTPVLAVGDGTVVLARYTDIGLGFYTVIDHGGGILTVYGHLSRIHVSEGQIVKQGQEIAEIGSTGYSTGPHLHFEVIQNQKNVNPRLHLK